MNFIVIIISSSNSNSTSMQFTSCNSSCNEPELCKACKLKVCRKRCAVVSEAEAFVHSSE